MEIVQYCSSWSGVIEKIAAAAWSRREIAAMSSPDMEEKPWPGRSHAHRSTLFHCWNQSKMEDLVAFTDGGVKETTLLSSTVAWGRHWIAKRHFPVKCCHRSYKRRWWGRCYSRREPKSDSLLLPLLASSGKSGVCRNPISIVAEDEKGVIRLKTCCQREVDSDHGDRRWRRFTPSSQIVNRPAAQLPLP